MPRTRNRKRRPVYRFRDEIDPAAHHSLNRIEPELVVRVEADSDGDGRPDRWQAWDRGRLVGEELDTDGDGRPDRRLVFGPRGRLLRVERLP